MKTWLEQVIEEWITKIQKELGKPSADKVSRKRNMLQEGLCLEFTFNIAKDEGNIATAMKHEVIFENRVIL